MPRHGFLFLEPVAPRAPATPLSSSPRTVVLTSVGEVTDLQGEGGSYSEAYSRHHEAEFQNQRAAVFLSDDNSHVTPCFVADTAFDCEQDGDEANWALSGD